MSFQRLLAWIGSIRIAVPLLIVIASVLGWGTVYEARFGTAAVQRFIYQAWWFQGLLGFLALNLAVAAIQRTPWKRKHIPFVLAHIGIILILFGGILGGRFGMEGQLVIPEGTAERVLRLPGHVLTVQQRNPGIEHAIQTAFEASAWNHEPNRVFRPPLEHRSVELTVDRYYPDAVEEEQVLDGGPEASPAARVLVTDGEHRDATWLFARDPERSGAQWEGLQVVLLEAPTNEDLLAILEPRAEAGRGMLRVEVPAAGGPRDIPVPEEPDASVEIEGTPYRITFKDYFPDLAITEEGLVSRSPHPMNPAVSFIISGPEGADPYLLFARHPEFQDVHGIRHELPVAVTYHHAGRMMQIPPQALAVIYVGQGTLMGIATDAAGSRTVLDPLPVGAAFRHPLGVDVTVVETIARARTTRQFRNRGSAVKSEALHVVAREGGQTVEAWVSSGEPVDLPLGEDPLRIAYRPGTRELPVTIKLLDFRKIDYPGTDMAAGFESDVELTDPQRGLILMRTIRMNQPLRYRGYSFYQASYVPGSVESTVLSVRSDPGTPFVYAGFLIVIAGVVGMFIWRRPGQGAPE